MSGGGGPRWAVLGAGSWGTALAIHLASSGWAVRLAARERGTALVLGRERRNARYLPRAAFPASLEISESPGEACSGAQRILVAVPAQETRRVLAGAASAIDRGACVVLAAKGIETGTLALQSEIASETLGGRGIVSALSGPSFAEELLRGDPTAVVVGCADETAACAIQEELSAGPLRVYTNGDLRGVQLGGSLKNVYALAAGMIRGLGFGSNTVAALVTRALTEMRRLGVAAGGRPETFDGLSGLGDLVLTCTGELSRNLRAGEELARGASLAQALATIGQTVEGVQTAASAHALAARHGIEMPIVAEVHAVVSGARPVREALGALMSRRLRSEELF